MTNFARIIEQPVLAEAPDVVDSRSGLRDASRVLEETRCSLS